MSNNHLFFNSISEEEKEIKNIDNARPLLLLGHSVTTDHISPAGAIKQDSPAGDYFMERQILQKDFNSYGARRGNHEDNGSRYFCQYQN